MCSKKSTKTEESNKKRLESLNERSNEFQLKKKLVRLSLHDLDSANKPKKIIFDDDDDEENVPKTVVNEEVEEPVKPKKAKKEKKEKKISTLIEEVKEKPKPEISNGESKKKLKLMDSDSENEEDTLKMLDSKVNLDQKKANKLIYLKTKFSNDDQRFKIDERFAENEEDVEDRSVKEEEEEEYNKEDDEDEDARPKKSNKKQLKKEKLSALKILEEITAKPILKPTEEPGSIEEKKLLKRREMLKSKPIVRYDPTKEEHKKFEINEDKEKELSSSDDSDKEEESRKGDDENEEVEEEKPPKIEEDTSKYFKVEPNLKDLFSSHDVFKFKFTQDESSESEKDEEDEENEEEEPARPINKLKPNLLLPTKRSKYSSSSSSESEYEGNDDEEYHEIENRKSQAREMNSSKQPMVRKPNLSEQNASFLPDFDKSKDILDALDYFANRKDDENCDLEKFRNEWSSQREKLVEECKKKHKRMIRIKKAQENKKLLPWRTSNKSIIKRNKTKK